MPTTKIRVTAADNELYIIASNPNGSCEVAHIKSGFHDPVEYAVVPQSVLPKGEYNLTLVGISWGGSQEFKVTLTTDGKDETKGSGPKSDKIGVVWTDSFKITV